MDKNAPCYGCERRKPLCHGSCEDYKEFKQEKEEEAKAIRKKKEDEAMVIGVLVNAAEKTVKERRRK